MASKFSPEKELPEPQFQNTEVRAFAFCPPNYEQHPTNYQPQAQPQPPPLPAQAQPPPPPAQPQTLYDQWVISSLGFPLQAVHAGYDIDQTSMYVARVFHNGDYIPAKAFQNTACFPYQGHEIVESNFEYLVGDKYIWINGPQFPPGAVVVNPISTNEHLYVGRCYYGGSLLCGKFVRSQNRLYVPFNYQEVPITGPYEILVHRDRYDSGIYT